jgi:hypothetical protein
MGSGHESARFPLLACRRNTTETRVNLHGLSPMTIQMQPAVQECCALGSSHSPGLAACIRHP